MSHKLDFLGMQFTRQPYWKDDGKSWNLREGMSKLKRYNALDASVTLEVFLRQTEELIESHGGGIGINEFLSEPTLAAGFGVERQTQTATRLSLVEVILHHMYSESSTNFSSTISNQEKNCIIDAKTKDASILGMESLSLTENIPLDTEDRKHIALKDTNSLQRTQEETTEDIDTVKSVIEKMPMSIICSARGSLNLYDFYRFYEMPLSRRFYSIGKRGTLTDFEAVSNLRKDVVKELDNKCISISTTIKRPVVYSTQMAIALGKQLQIDTKSILNIASVPQLKSLLQDELKVKLKTDRKTHKESTGEESLNEAFALTGNQILKDI